MACDYIVAERGRNMSLVAQKRRKNKRNIDIQLLKFTNFN